MRLCKRNGTQLLGMITRMSEWMHKRCVRERRLLMSRHVIILARGRRYSTTSTCGRVDQDAMSPSTFCGANLTLFGLSKMPIVAFISAATLNFWPNAIGEDLANCISTSRCSSMRQPRPRIPRREAVLEAVQFPRLCSTPVSIQNLSQPRIISSHTLCQYECLLNRIYVCTPKHFENALYMKRVVGQCGIGEYSRGHHRR